MQLPHFLAAWLAGGSARSCPPGEPQSQVLNRGAENRQQSQGPASALKGPRLCRGAWPRGMTTEQRVGRDAPLHGVWAAEVLGTKPLSPQGAASGPWSGGHPTGERQDTAITSSASTHGIIILGDHHKWYSGAPWASLSQLDQCHLLSHQGSCKFTGLYGVHQRMTISNTPSMAT